MTNENCSWKFCRFFTKFITTRKIRIKYWYNVWNYQKKKKRLIGLHILLNARIWVAELCFVWQSQRLQQSVLDPRSFAWRVEVFVPCSIRSSPQYLCLIRYANCKINALVYWGSESYVPLHLKMCGSNLCLTLCWCITSIRTVFGCLCVCIYRNINRCLDIPWRQWCNNPEAEKKTESSSNGASW